MKILSEHEYNGLIRSVFSTPDGEILLEQMLMRECMRSEGPDASDNVLRDQDGRRNFVVTIFNMINGSEVERNDG